MALGPSRVMHEGKTAHAHEREAIAFAKGVLPNVEPYAVWALCELLDSSTGRLLEIDLLVLGYRALYLVEIKSHPGRISGDAVDWTWEPPEGGRRYIEPPYRLTNHKARVLKGRLQQKLGRDVRLPWVQPLVFLSDPGLDLHLTPDGRVGVVTRDTLARAFTHHEFPSSPELGPPPIDRPTAKKLVDAMKAIGLRPRKASSFVGPYELHEILEEGSGYQDREAIHRDSVRMRARARVYLVPDGTTVERRQTLQRAANREAQLLYDVREHPSILRIESYQSDAECGPTLLLEDFAGAMPLPAFLRKEPDLSFDDRITILEQLGRALGFCHRKGVIHGALSPDAVLVRRRADDDDRLEIKLYDFQLGEGAGTDGTLHWSALAAEPWTLYQAPELREDAGRRTVESDAFSFGAVAYFVLTGRPPAESVVDLAARLVRDGKLDVRPSLEKVPRDVAELIDEATALASPSRPDDVGVFTELLVSVARTPAASRIDLDPLVAAPDDLLDGFIVERVLGQGVTARVLSVLAQDDNRKYALKVSLGDEHDDRLRSEARALEGLNHPRIAKSYGERTIGGRLCILLSLAGEQTLQRKLASEGSISLDYASRYGEDLLTALEYLEEADGGPLHRDIKPANIGVGVVSKSANHLTLFDFSLVDLPLTTLGVGTAAYRDPFLVLRGTWDRAADRWSAAMTLHEMLTGVRPTYAGAAIDPDSRLALTAERFDASARESLVRFFERAFDRDAERRFESAREMRVAWTHALEAPKALPARPESVASAENPAELPAAPTFDPASVSLGSSVETLPISNRAKNALDRAGLRLVRDLLGLPDNRLSAIRGVGREVAREIIEIREQIRAAHASAVEAESPKPFDATFAAPDVALDASGLPAELVAVLDDAGLVTLGAVAKSPEFQIDALAKRVEGGLAALRAALGRATRAAKDLDRPATLEGWVELFLGGSSAPVRHVQRLYGLSEPFVGRLDVTAKQVANEAGTTDANIYIALGKLRTKWRDVDACADLEALVDDVLDAQGRALPLDLAAKALLDRLPSASTPDGADEAALRIARAAALVHVVTEVAKDDPDGLRMIRLGRDALWVVGSQGHAEALRRLAAEADALAKRETVPGSVEARRAIELRAVGTPFASLPLDRLLDLACRASERAACSARLEIYPRQLAPSAALALSAALLTNPLTAAEASERVRQRYPEAAPLPPRPELDALLEAHLFRYRIDLNAYVREGESQGTSLGTATASALTSFGGAPSPFEPKRDRKAESADDFRHAMKAAIEGKGFRVLSTSPTRSDEAAAALVARFGLTRVSLDKALLDAMRAVAAEKKVSLDAIHAADREGARGPHWRNLRAVFEAAAARVAGELFPAKAPLLLTEPGLLARFGLVSFFETLFASQRGAEGDAVFVLVPSPDVAGVPPINGVYPIPGVLPHQARRIPSSFLGAA